MFEDWKRSIHIIKPILALPPFSPMDCNCVAAAQRDLLSYKAVPTCPSGESNLRHLRKQVKLSTCILNGKVWVHSDGFYVVSWKEKSSLNPGIDPPTTIKMSPRLYASYSDKLLLLRKCLRANLALLTKSIQVWTFVNILRGSPCHLVFHLNLNGR